MVATGDFDDARIMVNAVAILDERDGCAGDFGAEVTEHGDRYSDRSIYRS